MFEHQLLAKANKKNDKKDNLFNAIGQWKFTSFKKYKLNINYVT